MAAGDLIEIRVRKTRFGIEAFNFFYLYEGPQWSVIEGYPTPANLWNFYAPFPIGYQAGAAQHSIQLRCTWLIGTDAGRVWESPIYYTIPPGSSTISLPTNCCPCIELAGEVSDGVWIKRRLYPAYSSIPTEAAYLTGLPNAAWTNIETEALKYLNPFIIPGLPWHVGDWAVFSPKHGTHAALTQCVLKSYLSTQERRRRARPT